MDGKVLIIGKVVGWSGGGLKPLPSFKDRYGAVSCKPVFFEVFSGLNFFRFFRCWFDFGKFLEAKIEAKIDFSEVFFRCFFGIDFRSFFYVFLRADLQISCAHAVFY